MRTEKLQRAAVGGIVVLAALLTTTAAASAQWSVTGVGVAEWDTNETLLLLAGVSASPAGPGVRPVFGITASRLSFDVGTSTVTTTSFRPSAGLRNNYPGGSAQARIGYAFTNRDTSAVAATDFVDSRDGVVITGQVDHWGTGGPLGWQWLGAYNFGAQSLWTRGRVTTRVGPPEPRQIRVGGELAYMSGRDGFSAFAPGAVLEWHAGNGFILGTGIGRKLIRRGDDATYFRVEAVIPFVR
jgi:hypothetical protein